jgi:hypothetical protein
MSPRTALLCITITAGILLSGCIGAPTADQPSPAASAVDNGEATERALNAENAYVSARLENASCIDDWSFTQYFAEQNATVLNRTERGVVVEVTRPFSWTDDGLVTDAVSNPRYLVNETETVRLSEWNTVVCDGSKSSR